MAVRKSANKLMAGAQVTDDYAGREERESHYRQEEDQVSQVQHAFLEILEVRIDAEGADGLDQPVGSPTIEEVDHRRKARQQEQQANHHRDDKANHLIARHGGSQATDRQVSPGEQKTSHVAAEDHPVIWMPEIVDRYDGREGQHQHEREESP